MFKLFAIFPFIVFASTILDDFKTKGYHEILNETCGEECFSKVYGEFDDLVDFMQEHDEWTNQLFTCEHEFAESEENRPYGSPPMGYVDDKKSGKSKKKYFHFSEEYFDFMQEKYSDLISESKELEKLLYSLRNISDMAATKFEAALSHMPDEIGHIMHTDEGKLLLLTKIVRYDPAPQAASHPHYDFSGLSFLFDNSELDEEESLLIAPYQENLMIEDFRAPDRKYKRSEDCSSLLLIPGLAFKQLGFGIDPVPHAVKKQNKTRYAIIVFAMVPNVKLTYEDIKVRL